MAKETRYRVSDNLAQKGAGKLVLDMLPYWHRGQKTLSPYPEIDIACRRQLRIKALTQENKKS